MATCEESRAITYFAPAGRDSDEQLRHSEELVCQMPLFQAVLDAMPQMIAVLNSRRQTIGCNRALCDALGMIREQILGKRPGELLECINVKRGPDGCGTSYNCAACGAVNAILESQRGRKKTTCECRMLLESGKDGGALDLCITASNFDLAGDAYTILSITDISKSKRLAVLTRVFFHDVLNTAGGIHGFTEMLAEEMGDTGLKKEEVVRLKTLADMLIEEIEEHRDLIHAESGDLATRFEPVDVELLLHQLQAMYASHDAAAGRTLRVGESWRGSLLTDRRLLARVLGNMLKNALEAAEPGDEVTIDCVEEGGKVVFRVHNPTVMPEHAQLQMFQRSFSTKAAHGRGVGAYGMRLLGEKYLGGRVGFTSQMPEGTIFTMELPKEPAITPTEMKTSAPAAWPRGRVLLAESSEVQRQWIGFLLKRAGVEVDYAENGWNACEKALDSVSEGRPYDLILMDVEMPEMDGREATRQLREYGWQGPIIAMSLLGSKSDRIKCIEAGCTDCAAKPFDGESLLATIGNHLRAAKSRWCEGT